jgi:hypothetical protein
MASESTINSVESKMKGSLNKYANQLNCSYKDVAIHIDGIYIESEEDGVDDALSHSYALYLGTKKIAKLEVENVFELNIIERFAVSHNIVKNYIQNALEKFAVENNVALNYVKIMVYANDEEFNPNLLLFISSQPKGELSTADILGKD